MKKLMFLVLIALIAGGCKNNDKHTNDDEDHDQQAMAEKIDIEAEKKMVELVLDKYVIANESQETNLVKEVWASDSDIVVFGTNSDEKLIGWDQISAAVQRQFNSFEETYISVRDQIININETGNTAWFSEVVNYNFLHNGEAKSFEGLRFTGVLEKMSGSWFIVQSHMSIPAAED